MPMGRSMLVLAIDPQHVCCRGFYLVNSPMSLETSFSYSAGRDFCFLSFNQLKGTKMKYFTIIIFSLCLTLLSLNCKKDSSPTEPPGGPPAPKIARAQLFVPGDTTSFSSVYNYHDGVYFVTVNNPRPVYVGLPLDVKLFDSSGHNITNQFTSPSAYFYYLSGVVDDTSTAFVQSFSRSGGSGELIVKQPPFGAWWTKQLNVYAFVHQSAYPNDSVRTQTISNIVAKPPLYTIDLPDLPDVNIVINGGWLNNPYGYSVFFSQVGDSIGMEIVDKLVFNPTTFGDGSTFHFEGGAYSIDGSWSSYTQASGTVTGPLYNGETQFSFSLVRYRYTGP